MDLTHMTSEEVFFCLMGEKNLQGGVPPPAILPLADVLLAEVHQLDLGSTVAGGQLPTRRCWN